MTPERIAVVISIVFLAYSLVEYVDREVTGYAQAQLISEAK